jgi:hypothetical protein
LDKPVLVANISQCAFDNTSGFPSLAIDRGSSSYRHRLYVAWNAKNSGESRRCQIYFSYSTDAGKSWSAPVRVNDDVSNGTGRPGPDDYGPTLAVNRDGIIGIAWHDRRVYPDNLGYEMRFAASLDGGRSFVPSVPISAGIRPRWANTQMPLSVEFSTEGDETEAAGFSLPLVDGDYNGMAAGADGMFHAIWSDARSGIGQIWTAAVRVAPDDSLRNLYRTGYNDVSKFVKVTVLGARYLSVSHDILLDVALVNHGQRAVLSPKLYLLSLRSEIGCPRAINADNKESASGAIWAVIMKNDGILPAHAESPITSLRFHIDRPLPFNSQSMSPLESGGGEDSSRFITIRAKVFARY